MTPWVSFVLCNPVNQTDPTGLTPEEKPCKEVRGGRYCVLDDGGFLDMDHYRTSKSVTADLLKRLRENDRPGYFNKPLPVKQPLIAQINYYYQLTYRTNLPEETLSDPELIRVALGIFMDFQIRYEIFQGADPRCGPFKFIPGCSSFSNEDLVSDYLGFLDSADASFDFDSIIRDLGGGQGQKDKPDGDHPKNYRFTSFSLLEKDECGNYTVIRRHLPGTFKKYTPLQAGTYWDVPENYVRINLGLYY